MICCIYLRAFWHLPDWSKAVVCQHLGIPAMRVFLVNHYDRKTLLNFKFWQLAISKPVEVGKGYGLQKKAPLPVVWEKSWNWNNLYHYWPQTSSCKSSAFSFKGMWPLPSGWWHTKGLSWVWKLSLRAFNWSIFFSKVFWDGSQNSWNIFLKSCCMISIAQHCRTRLVVNFHFTLKQYFYS